MFFFEKEKKIIEIKYRNKISKLLEKPNYSKKRQNFRKFHNPKNFSLKFFLNF